MAAGVHQGKRTTRLVDGERIEQQHPPVNHQERAQRRCTEVGNEQPPSRIEDAHQPRARQCAHQRAAQPHQEPSTVQMPRQVHVRKRERYIDQGDSDEGLRQAFGTEMIQKQAQRRRLGTSLKEDEQRIGHGEDGNPPSDRLARTGERHWPRVVVAQSIIASHHGRETKSSSSLDPRHPSKRCMISSFVTTRPAPSDRSL